MEIEAVVIIEIVDGAPNLVQAFTRDDKGIEKAHKLFKRIAKENHYSDDDIQTALNYDGYIQSAEGTHNINISYS